VVAIADEPDRYLIIDGHQRVEALEQLGQDTVEAVVWPLSEAEALVLDRSLRMEERETALEEGWLLAELEQRFGYGLEELARRFDRSVSWVSRRLAMVELLPETLHQQVRAGAIAAHVAMKYLVPMARAKSKTPSGWQRPWQRMATAAAKQANRMRPGVRHRPQSANGFWLSRRCF
jgi:ParB/RepB/Spo0J family partition protein